MLQHEHAFHKGEALASEIDKVSKPPLNIKSHSLLLNVSSIPQESRQNQFMFLRITHCYYRQWITLKSRGNDQRI